ncbi:hypothetical protein J7363_04750 [Phaeobacter italicus]|uniref:transcription termination/antitermination protein NusG n=1 Tax=Phaeobacter italicus TaxID=481446 RepID=UPI001ADB4D5E|nr:hypothetical protein [Phaeobacter italicus]MBO9441390.1 hypothetical protein [Phaeobacter italicus]
MTNTYAINTTRGKEFEVEQELRSNGLKPWAPRRLDSRYVKEKRETVWYDRPYVPKLLFCVVPAIYWRDVVELKHVIGKPIKLSRLDIEGDRSRGAPGLRDFKAAVGAEYADASRRKENSEYQCQYEPGQALELLAGTFEGFPATFKDVIRRAHDEYAKLRVSVEMFGREVLAEIDPDKVKGAA